MKFDKNISRITICFLILISNIVQIYSAKENTNSNRSSRTLNKNRSHAQLKSMARNNVQFHSNNARSNDKFSQTIKLKAFNLNGSGQLFANCPKYSVMVKLIFQKRNDHILDVGFNCRRDYKNIIDDVISTTTKVEADNFDTMTPPNAVCQAGRALSGYEFSRMNRITYFKYYCTKVKNMHNQSTIADKYFPNAASVLDPMERKSLSRFFTHTDITVALGKYTKYAINSINFSRGGDQAYQKTAIAGTLSYNYSISKIGGANGIEKTDTPVVKPNINNDKKDSDIVTPDSPIVENHTYGLSVPQLKIIQKILENIQQLGNGKFDVNLDLSGLTVPEQQELLSAIYKLTQLYGQKAADGTTMKYPMDGKDKNGVTK